MARAKADPRQWLTEGLRQFIVMFRSRFNDVLPSKLPHFGPQDIERGVMDGPPTPQAQQLLCAVLALVLNRKKPVEYVGLPPKELS